LIGPVDGHDNVSWARAATSWNPILDLVFSIDSIVIAVGMTDDLSVMITAVVIAVIVMLVAADPLASFIRDNLRCHAGAWLPSDDRYNVDRGGLRGPCTEKLRLHSYGVLGFD